MTDTDGLIKDAGGLRPGWQERVRELDALEAKLRRFFTSKMCPQAADAIAELRGEIESLRAECGLRQIRGYNEGKASGEARAVEMECRYDRLTVDYARVVSERNRMKGLLLRWLQIINRAKKDAASVADWDKLRQDSDAAVKGKP